MPDEQQITWDSPQAAPPPQVSWDEPEEKKPEGFLQRVWKSLTWVPPGLKNYHVHSELPEGAGFTGVSEAAGEAAKFAERKRNEAEQSHLHELAVTGKNNAPMSAYSPSAGWDLAARTAKTVSGMTSPTSQAVALGTVAAPEIVGPALVAHGGYTALKHAPGALGGNPEEAEASLGGLAEATGGTAITHGALTTKPTVKQSLAESTTGKAVSPIVDLAQRAMSRLRTPEAQQALTQAAQPGIRIPKAQESIAIAGPRIQQIRQAKGVDIPAKGPEALKVVLDLNREAKVQILSAIEDRMGPVADLRPNANVVAKGIRGAVDDLTVEQTPGLRESMERRASTYDREGGSNWTIRQMENRMHTLNNRLANAYSQATPGEARISAETEMDLAEARELRKLIDESVEKLSGEGVKDLKREYGAQRDLEKGLARQYAIASRTKNAPLWEGLAYLQAAGDFVTGGVWGAAKGAAKIAIGNRLQLLRDSGYLANQAFHGPQAFRPAARIPPHTPIPPKGLLPAPATELGFTEEPQGPITRPQNKGLLAEPAPIEAEFIPRRVPTGPTRLGVNRMLPSGELPATNIPPIPTITRETTLPPDETRLGPTGEGGVRIPIKGLLPAAREAAGIPKPTTFKGGINPQGTEALTAGKRSPASEAALLEDTRRAAAEGNPEERAAAKARLREMGEPEAAPKFVERREEIRPAFNEAAVRAAKEPEPVETKIKGITAEGPKAPRAKREELPAIEKRYSPEEITEAEGMLASEAGAMAAADRPGVYYDESEAGDVRLRSRGAQTKGGDWRGVRSGREMFPFMREHPEMNPEAVLKALRNKDSAFYKRAMTAAIDFVNRSKAVGEAAEPAQVEPGAEEFPFGAKAGPEEKPVPVKEPEGVLPGMGEHVRAQEAGAGRVKAEELAREINTPRSIESAAGEMETKSPLFRGTAASPQNEMFGQQALKGANGAGKETYWKGDKAVYTGNKKEIAGGLFYELKLTEGHLKGETKWTQKAPSE